MRVRYIVYTYISLSVPHLRPLLPRGIINRVYLSQGVIRHSRRVHADLVQYIGAAARISSGGKMPGKGGRRGKSGKWNHIFVHFCLYLPLSSPPPRGPCSSSITIPNRGRRCLSLTYVTGYFRARAQDLFLPSGARAPPCDSHVCVCAAALRSIANFAWVSACVLSRGWRTFYYTYTDVSTYRRWERLLGPTREYFSHMLRKILFYFLHTRVE